MRGIRHAPRVGSPIFDVITDDQVYLERFILDATGVIPALAGKDYYRVGLVVGMYVPEYFVTRTLWRGLDYYLPSAAPTPAQFSLTWFRFALIEDARTLGRWLVRRCNNRQHSPSAPPSKDGVLLKQLQAAQWSLAWATLRLGMKQLSQVPGAVRAEVNTLRAFFDAKTATVKGPRLLLLLYLLSYSPAIACVLQWRHVVALEEVRRSCLNSPLLFRRCVSASVSASASLRCCRRYLCVVCSDRRR